MLSSIATVSSNVQREFTIKRAFEKTGQKPGKLLSGKVQWKNKNEERKTMIPIAQPNIRLHKAYLMLVAVATSNKHPFQWEVKF